MAINYPEHPAPINEGRCNALTWNCKGDDPETGERCDYHFNDEHETHCPICETERSRCKAYPMKDTDTCRVHGGRSIQKTLHPNYLQPKERRLPQRLLQSYMLALDDPNVLSLEEDVALFIARRDDLLSRVDDTPSDKLWQKLRDTFKKYVNYRNDYARSGSQKSATRANEALYEVENLIAKGFGDSLTWREIERVQQTIIKLKTEERKRKKEIAEIITPEQFRTLIGYIINSIDTRVSDKELKMDLISDIQKLNFRNR